MKIYKPFLTTMLLALFFISCKKDNSEKAIEVVADTIAVQTIDTAALIQKAKSDMIKLAKPYNVSEDAQLRIDKLVEQANKEGKNVFIQAGGNWCIWCLRFTDFIENTPELKTILDNNYLYYHLNYSKENKNEAVFEKYAPNGRELGFPFFIVIDKKGDVLDVISSETVANEEDQETYYDILKTKELFLKYAPNK